ncbi:MAG: phenylalanine--tRNA ligase subunit beta [Armatimonadota bacterium]
MKVPVSWLRDHVEVPEDADGLAAFCDRLTMAGLEVEEILEGPVLHTKVTPNRGDWASIRGTAREAAAADPALRLAPPMARTLPADAGSAPLRVRIEDSAAFPRYAALAIRGVRIGPAPEWIADRLRMALGDRYRPVNNVVDITNYVMLELGQPLHAFDLSTIPGGTIVVRRAVAGETLRTLDGEERVLSPEVLCICDEQRPIAVAGIMGGADTEVGVTTTDLLLESAHFDPVAVRKGSKTLGLASEASYRFERHVDPQLVPTAAERAARLILETAGGSIDGGLVDVHPHPKPPVRVLARIERIRRILGVDFDRDEAIAALERLGIEPERSAGALDCLVPSWRPDLTIEEDIAEEIGRIALGYDRLPETLPAVNSGRGRDTEKGRFASSVRALLVAAGLQDVVAHSLVSPETAWTETERAIQVAIRNPMAPQYSALRTSLLPGLVSIAARAAAGGQRDFALFETGPVYVRRPEGGYDEPERIAGLVAGSALAGLWGVRPDALAADFHYAKGVVEELLAGLGIHDFTWERAVHPIAHPYRCAALRVGGVLVGTVGEISARATLTSRDADSGQVVALGEALPKRTCYFDLDAAVLRAAPGAGAMPFRRLSRFPAATRDLAPVFPVEVPWASIDAAVRRVSGEDLESMRLVDRYAGANLGEGKHALTLRFVFRRADRTLRSDEVDGALAAVRLAIEEIGGELRG